MRFHFPTIAILLVGPLVAIHFTNQSFADTRDLNQPEVKQRVDQLVQPYLDSERVQGLSIGLILGNSQRTFHYGKVADGGPAPNDTTVYEIGSVSKVFTGLLLADAVVRQNNALDQNAEELLPEGFSMPSKQGRKIMLVDLSTHRSGLPAVPNNMPNVRTDDPYRGYTSELAFEFLKGHELQSVPGEKMAYSNFAASLLGNLICRQAGTSYDQLLTQRIAKPLAMDDTTVVANQAALARLAQGHDEAGNPMSPWDFADMPGAGGIRSTIPDMLKFANANLSPPNGELGKAIELAWKQHRAGSGNGFAMGLGWHIARDGETRWHNGQTGGFHSIMFVNRKVPAAVIVMTNTATMEIDRLAEKMIQLLAGANVKPDEMPKGKKVDPAVMNSLAGKYQLTPQLIFTVSVVKDRLMVGLSGQPSFQVYPKSDYEWEYKVIPATLTFKKGDDGKASELVLFQNGVRQSAKRIE